MKTLRVLRPQDVRALLTMDHCIPLMERTLLSLTEDPANIQPLRTSMKLTARSGQSHLLGMMPAYSSFADSFGIKIVSVHGGHAGGVLVFDGETGAPVAYVDAAAITAIRTAAVSAVATRALAREDSEALALLGTGVQAETHLEAMLCVRKFRRVHVYGRTSTKLATFVEAARSLYPTVDFQAHADVRVAIQNADVICTLTSSKRPLITAQTPLKAGVHINAVGACTPDASEVDLESVMGSKLIVDSRESALNECANLKPGQIHAELGEVLAKVREGRADHQEITIFKSLGLGIEDIAAAHFVYTYADDNTR